MLALSGKHLIDNVSLGAKRFFLRITYEILAPITKEIIDMTPMKKYIPTLLIFGVDTVSGGRFEDGAISMIRVWLNGDRWPDTVTLRTANV